MKQNYSQRMCIYYEQLISGFYQLDEWDKMTLRSSIKEGVDYVLVSSTIWYHSFNA